VSALANLAPVPFSQTPDPKAGCHIFMGKCSWTEYRALLGTAQIPWLCTEILPSALGSFSFYISGARKEGKDN